MHQIPWIALLAETRFPLILLPICLFFPFSGNVQWRQTSVDIGKLNVFKSLQIFYFDCKQVSAPIWHTIYQKAIKDIAEFDHLSPGLI